ncbi:MAG: DEAD/DEAH box helicase, partial [Novosphingobium sp.]|nr:DEAD/DEAH box helicase [Novosphingobium sp.]
MTFFTDLGLAEPIVRALDSRGYADPTPIQRQAIPALLEGRDLLGCAQTGTGKTAAFALPVLHRLLTDSHVGRDSQGRKQRRPAIGCLVLVPTRELALQVQRSFQTYGAGTKLRQTAIYGGVSQNPQVKALQSGVQVVIATPGRLLDLINQGHVRLDQLQILVLDEADQMLDMGFVHDLRKIVEYIPAERQTLMFSATMPTEIRNLASQWLRQPR